MGMNELAELHRTPSLNHVSAQSPRVGGCVGTFFHMFDWNPGKKIFTTKRLPAGSSLSSYPTSSHLLLLLFLFLYVSVCLPPLCKLPTLQPMFGNCRLEALGAAAAAHLYFEAFGYVAAKLKRESIPSSSLCCWRCWNLALGYCFLICLCF